MMVQLAAYKGYIDVNWGKISGDTKKGLLDQVPHPFLICFRYLVFPCKRRAVPLCVCV